MANKRTWLKRLAIVATVLFVISGATLSALYYLYQVYVVENPGDHLKRDDILRRISMESPVLYRDGVHKIGVFFGAEHRQYVKYDDIPPDFVHAIVSSEDKDFFSHHGIDPKGILRAFKANIKARRVVAGGSTITQQTAKNLYYRADRSWESKGEELINALRLEAHYSKKDILEFYVNQFHVHSNGRGLGIAARYFFDKEVKELTTLECAFLAGVVKSPFRYNPFVGSTEDARKKARKRAAIRTHYVLDRMGTDGWLKPDEVTALKKEELHFKEGDFRYDQNVILDYVFDVLQEERFARLLQEHGIDNPATAGIQVITTIDQAYQQAAQYGLRHNLSDTGAMLEGLTVDAFLGPDANLMPMERDSLYPYGFYEGAVKEPFLTGPGSPGLEIDLGGITGRVDKEGLRRVASLLKRAEGKNTWTQASDKDVKALLEKFPAGRTVWVSVNAIGMDGVPKLDLEARTELQGALTILDRGLIRAMVGGQDNRNFNRVAQARRQLGSTFKPLIFAAATTLGWGSLSPLDNRRQGFYYQGQWYWPRPDHDGVQPYISMAFAGSTSENVASVSLLYHLTDLLTSDQMRDLAGRVGLTPNVGENSQDYTRRMRDQYGIIPTDASLAEGLYEALKRDLKIEMAFNGKAREATELGYLPYGNGFEAEAIRTVKLAPPPAERQARQRFLDRSFMHLEDLSPKALAAAETILRGTSPAAPSPSGLSGLVHSLFGSSSAPTPSPEPPPGPEAVAEAMRHFYTRKDGEVLRLIYSQRGDPAWGRPTLSDVRFLLSGGSGPSVTTPIDVPGVKPGTEPAKKPEKAERDPNAPPDAEMRVEPESPAPAPPGANPAAMPGRPEELILLEGALSPTTVTEIRLALNAKIAESANLEKYDLNRLVLHQDFRIMVGLQYVIQLARAMGVRSQMKPVLSLALGTNEITLLEAAMIYQTFLEGKAYTSATDTPDTAIIQQIKDATGHVIYELEQKEHPVLDPSVGPPVGRILRSVVDRGTAYKAKRAVIISSPDPVQNKKLLKLSYVVPMFGKTGTTNDYTNVAFIGFVPNPSLVGKDLPYGQALTIAAYVGYDDNRPMKRGSIRVMGSSGALPAWLDTARGVVRTQNLSSFIDPTVLSPGVEVKIGWPRDMAPVAVDATTGLRNGVGVIASEDDVPPNSAVYDIYGSSADPAWREREAYLPFTPWGQVLETALPAVDAAAAQADAPIREEVPAQPASPAPETQPAAPLTHDTAGAGKENHP